MIARAEAGAPSGALADVDVSAVVADVAELYGPVAEDEGITVETAITAGVHLHANRELIGQAMVNLLENAVKYAKPAGGLDRPHHHRPAPDRWPRHHRSRRQRPGHPPRGPQARHRTLRPPGKEPHRSRLGPGPVAGGRRDPPARRRVQHRGQRAGGAGGDGFAGGLAPLSLSPLRERDRPDAFSGRSG